ncbi:MAG: PAS domain-containing protein [Candidatus Marinimicrobia bacterium]|nr:PAS domain-containing protein [Candidatus Neomarinimicrobiota bacterium]
MRKKTKPSFKDRPSNNEHLLQIEKRYNAFINSSEYGIWRFESAVPIPINLPESDIIRSIFENGILVECNQSYAQMHSYSKPEDIIGAPLLKFVRQNDPQLITIFKNFIHSGFRLTNVEYHRHSDNAPEMVFIINLFGVIEDNYLVQTWGVQRDISRQIRFQEQIQSLSAQIEQFSQISADIITITDENKLFRRISDAIVEITGWGTQLDPQRLVECGIERVIAKPFQVDQIGTLVSECIQLAYSPSGEK